MPESTRAATSPSTPLALYGGRYQLLELVGVGGGGSVYRARDVELDEIVALKVLRKELVRDAKTVDRFRNEVRLARRTTHRNVARMFDTWAHSDFLDGTCGVAARRGPAVVHRFGHERPPCEPMSGIG